MTVINPPGDINLPPANARLWKITLRDEIHHGLQYHDGLVEDTLEWKPSGCCSSGGLHFAPTSSILEFASYGPWIREVTLPPGTPTYRDPGMRGDYSSEEKYKAPRLYMGPRRAWAEPSTLRELLAAGAAFPRRRPVVLAHALASSPLAETADIVLAAFDEDWKVRAIYSALVSLLRETPSEPLVRHLMGTPAGQMVIADEGKLPTPLISLAVRQRAAWAIPVLASLGANVDANGGEALYAANGYSCSPDAVAALLAAGASTLECMDNRSCDPRFRSHNDVGQPGVDNALKMADLLLASPHQKIHHVAAHALAVEALDYGWTDMMRKVTESGHLDMQVARRLARDYADIAGYNVEGETFRLLEAYAGSTPKRSTRTLAATKHKKARKTGKPANESPLRGTTRTKAKTTTTGETP